MFRKVFKSHKSHRRDSITEEDIKSRLKNLGFNVTNKESIRHEIKRLDKEVIDLIGNNDAYWRNRKACWDLTTLLVLEVK